MTREEILSLVKLSLDGEFQVHSIDQFCQTYPDITEDEGYLGQEMRVQILESEGHHVTGWKLGGTSLAKIGQMKKDIYAGNAKAVSDSPKISYGRLMEYMAIAPDGDLQMERRLHPKVEPEIALIMGEDLAGEFTTPADVMRATEYLAPSFEIIDSRFHNFKIGRRFDALIDDTSSAEYKLGIGRVKPEDIDLYNMGMQLRKNGELIAFGAGAAIMGHPARAVATLVRMLAKRGYGLKKGDIILSGAITPSTPIHAGESMRADFAGLGYVEIKAV